MDALDFHVYFGLWWELPAALVVCVGLYSGMRALGRNVRWFWHAAAACLATGIGLWQVSAPLTQRLLPPVVMYMIMASFGVTAIGGCCDRSLPLYARLLALILAGSALVALMLWWWTSICTIF